MKNLISTLLTSILVCTAAQASVDLRMVETSPELAKAMLAKHPVEIRALSANVLLIPSGLVTEMAQTAHELTGHCGGFIDITGERLRPNLMAQRVNEWPPLNGKKDPIVAMLADVRGDYVRDFDNYYANQFITRNARSKTGEAAPHWLQEKWQKMADRENRGDVRVDLLPPPNGLKQNSVRITIPGSDLTLPVVVMGAHLDSINARGGESAPGQDDDASGIAALTEAYRILLTHGVKPLRTIQIFGYAAEELGLLGSRVVAEHYQSKGFTVRAVLQLDMVAYPGEDHTVTFIVDHVDKGLTLWTEQLFGLYVGFDVKEDECGYACSDHASWTRYGYPSVMPFETSMSGMNHRIHSERDVWDSELDPVYASLFTKLAVAFAAELSSN